MSERSLESLEREQVLRAQIRGSRHRQVVWRIAESGGWLGVVLGVVDTVTKGGVSNLISHNILPVDIPTDNLPVTRLSVAALYGVGTIVMSIRGANRGGRIDHLEGQVAQEMHTDRLVVAMESLGDTLRPLAVTTAPPPPDLGASEVGPSAAGP